MPLDKTYNPAETEKTIYNIWEKSGFFEADPKSDKPPYTIMMPPPNVTGSLHMGHALSYTLQDILIRFERMHNKDVLWQPGTDHASIATQMVVERQLAEENLDRRSMGREAFLERVWEWKNQSGNTITKQLRRLGASCDWSRERFTMDEGLNKAVIKVFVDLYKQGLIYKDKRLVNWDPKMLTAISDLEVEQKNVKGSLWYFRYPIEGGFINTEGDESCDDFIIVATTRPETMLGDTAVAVHPENPKLKHLIGKTVVLPLTDRLIPIIADEYADPEKGTGAVKITPAHDFNDFDVGKRHNLPFINVMDKFGKMNDNAPDKYRGLDRFEARKLIVSDMEELGLLCKIEPHMHVVPHGDRSGVPIEPWLSEQWYCNAPELAKEAIAVVDDGRIKFVPEQWANTYYSWVRNIEPWCISRQLWWGHQIPAWYAPDGTYFVEETAEEAYKKAKEHFGKAVELTRDDDVLDTWFSAGLWPFSTLGYPEETPELKRYYPSDVLVTGFDIIFFWVARMIMMGCYCMKDVPFRTVYIHAIVRDEKGQKMSKTKGNVIDPLTVIDEYGCDALRFTLANMSTPGRDIKLAASRIEGNRNFATKLWNAAKFCEMNSCVLGDDLNPLSVSLPVNKWIVQKTAAASKDIEALLKDYRFDLSSACVYDFVWSTFCDWYIEFAKIIFNSGDEASVKETRAVMAWVMEQLLIMLHPFMPYITEELWSKFLGKRELLIDCQWSDFKGSDDKSAEEEIQWLIDVISSIRALRAELNVPAKSMVPLIIKEASSKAMKRINAHSDTIKRLARIERIDDNAQASQGCMQVSVRDAVLLMPLSGIIDFSLESLMLQKEVDKITSEIAKIDTKLSNASFVDKAPKEIVEEQNERRALFEKDLVRIQSALQQLMENGKWKIEENP
ncbi:MAG: valine--tRNA ligase [Alphaproteobacteria bacterium]|nr:valine--tRNA ligase [Alphaproteobacteria bacterium]